MVIVQFRGHLVRQYRACVIDSLELGITCVLYHCTWKGSQSCLPCFLCHPYILHSICRIFYIYFLNLLIIMVQVSSNATSSKKIPQHRLVMYMYMYVGQMHVHRLYRQFACKHYAKLSSKSHCKYCVIILVQVSNNATSSKKMLRRI